MESAIGPAGAEMGIGASTTSGPRSRSAPVWRIREGEIPLRAPVTVGIVNLTPDSFSDGGRYRDAHEAVEAARGMVEAGAALVDVGGESTRPGAAPVPAREEIRRLVPFLRRAASELLVPLSVDTRKAEVARAALDEGAAVVNDVSGLRHDPGLGEVVAEAGAGLVLMHMRGEPADMAERAVYRDVVGEVRQELRESLARALAAGVPRDRIVVDPGLGFAKTAPQSLALLRGLTGLLDLGQPILVGPSRKSFLGWVLDLPPEERVEGTLAACVAAYLKGARLFRVHDVLPVVRALAVAAAVQDGEAAGREP